MIRRIVWRQLVPRLRRSIQPRQRAQRLEVVAVDPIGGEPRVERVALAAELVFPDLAEVLVQQNLIVVARCDRDLALDDLDELFPLLGGAS